MEYKPNNNIVYSCKYHAVFWPKYRLPVLVDGVDARSNEIVEQIASKFHFDVIEQEIISNRVHLLLEGDPQFGILKAAKRIKGHSSRTLRDEFPWPKTHIDSMDEHLFCICRRRSATFDNQAIHQESKDVLT